MSFSLLEADFTAHQHVYTRAVTSAHREKETNTWTVHDVYTEFNHVLLCSVFWFLFYSYLVLSEAKDPVAFRAARNGIKKDETTA